LGFACACPRAYADSDPFEMDTAHWMSFEHYKDAVKRGVVDMPAASSETPAIETPTLAPATSDQQVAAPPPLAPETALPVIASPKRPLDLPPMPGLNKGFDVKVTSTEDDAASTPAPVITASKPEAAPDIHISDKNWQNPASISRYKKSMPVAAAHEDDTPPPIDVRMTYLPDPKITPVPSPEHVSTQHNARLALEKSMAAKNKPKPAADAAVCAAIDAYKKQQLDAIQSDRQTLKALQDAISSLGLQKQLGFMTGGDSALNQTGPQVKMDMPASPTTVR
jgi:hypothetical protein